MGLNIYTNMPSMVAQSKLGVSNNAMAGSIEKLSSGLRINHASDDASGMSISEKLRGQIRGMAKASMNAQDAISYLQTAEGGLEVITDMLHRMRELAVQAGNAGYTANDRRELQKEVNQLKAEINRVSASTEFNTQKLLSGDTSAVWSASTDDINALMTGQPVAEGNYKLAFSVNPGQNAVYKTGILLDSRTFEREVEAALNPYDDITYTNRIDSIPTIPGTYEGQIVISGGFLSIDPGDDSALFNTMYDEGYDTDMLKIGRTLWSDYSFSSHPDIALSGTDLAHYAYVSKADGTYERISNSALNALIPNANISMDKTEFYSGTFAITKTASGQFEARSITTEGTGGAPVDVTYSYGTSIDGSPASGFGWGGTTLTPGGYFSVTFDGACVTELDSILGNVGDTMIWHVVNQDLPTLLDSTGAALRSMEATYVDIDGLNPSSGGGFPVIFQRDNGNKMFLTGMEAINGKPEIYVIGSDINYYSEAFHVFGIPGAEITPPEKGYAINVSSQSNRTSLNDIDSNGLLDAAGVAKLQANGEADILYGANIAFDLIPSPQNTVELIGSYTTVGANSYVDTINDSAVTILEGGASGYLEVNFTENMTADSASKVLKAEFTFVDASTGERRTINAGNISDFTLSASNTLNFKNGVKLELNFGAEVTNNVISAGDKLLFSITGNATTTVNEAFATLTLDDGSAGPAIAVSKTAGASTTLTAVKLTNDGKFETANLSWRVGESGLTGATFGVEAVKKPIDLAHILRNIKLKDLPSFTNADNRMVLDNTQVITIYGNDREVDIAIEGNDTLDDLMYKLGDAISRGLDMGTDNVLPQDLAKLITAAGTGNFAVMGTIVLQTALVGAQSELRFTGDENVLNALGFAQIQNSRESEVHVTVTNAHNNAFVGEDIVNDRMLRGIIGGVDVKIDSRVGLAANLDSTTGEMRFVADHTQTAYLHVANRETDVQVGANEGITLNISVARVDTKSLEIDGAYLMTREDSQKALTKFEQALERVNRVRSQIGAQVNRMEDAMRNLATGGQNMVAAQSRIKDLDVAEESMNFAKNQVLVNAAVAMLAQANQQPQMAMQLISGR